VKYEIGSVCDLKKSHRLKCSHLEVINNSQYVSRATMIDSVTRMEGNFERSTCKESGSRVADLSCCSSLLPAGVRG
jgi:hypothetical protein